jgi:hypothetical protein
MFGILEFNKPFKIFKSLSHLLFLNVRFLFRKILLIELYSCLFGWLCCAMRAYVCSQNHPRLKYLVSLVHTHWGIWTWVSLLIQLWSPLCLPLHTPVVNFDIFFEIFIYFFIQMFSILEFNKPFKIFRSLAFIIFWFWSSVILHFVPWAYKIMFKFVYRIW